MSPSSEPSRGSAGVARQATLLGVQVVLAAALFGLLLLLAERSNRRFDLTPNQAFVLSEAAQRVARGTTVPVRIVGFYNGQDSDQRRKMQDVLELFAGAATNLTYRLADLDRSPALAQRYGIQGYGSGVVEIDSGEFRELRAVDEEEITNALLKLTRRTTRRVCFLTGHGERNPLDSDERRGYSGLGKALESEHFEVEAIDVFPVGDMSERCSIVLLASPRHDLLEGEGDRLAAYLEAGGRVLLLLDSDASESAIHLARRYGVEVGTDLVVDERNRLYGADSYMARVPIFAKELFGANLDTAAVFPLSRTVEPASQASPGQVVLRIALSTDESYARVGSTQPPEEESRFRPQVDKPGPLTVGVMVTGKAGAPIPLEGAEADEPGAGFGRLIVFGDADFASNLYLNVLGNKDLVLSTLGALAEDPDLVAVRRKSLPPSSLSPIFLTGDQGQRIFWVAVVLLPGFFALLGILITWRRRYHASK